MKICVVHPQATRESAKRLATALKAVLWNPYKQDRPRGPFDLYFNYGVSDCPAIELPQLQAEVVNYPRGVAVSTNKIQTYKRLTQEGVPTCSFVTRADAVPNRWKEVVCRSVINGSNCEGLLITDRDDIVPGCPLYTEYFEHDEEHRIVVFKGEVVARYMKTNLLDGEYDLTYMFPNGYKELDATAIKAANAVGLNYAGIDLLYDSTRGQHICLEVNSGPLLTDEVADWFSNYYKVK